MSIKHLNQAFDIPMDKSSLKFILVALADYANEQGEAYPSTETICSKTALNRKTVLAGLSQLEGIGFISDTGQRKGKTGQIKVWQLTISNNTKNGILKESQKRNSTKNGTVPFFPDNNTKNGTLKESQKRDTEPSVLLTTNEPSVKKITRAKKFTPPTEIEIANYAEQEGLSLIGFFDYYESNGWMVGKNKMKNWQAAARNWSRRDGTRSNQATSGQLTGAARRSADFHENLKTIANGVGSQTIQQATNSLHPPMDKRLSNA